MPFRSGRRMRRFAAILALAVSFLAFLIPAVRFFRMLTGAMAISNAADRITRSVSDIVEEKMRQLREEDRRFVLYDKDENGNITAIVTDTAQVNILSAELLESVIETADAGDLDISVPLGDLLGFSLLLGKGPRIPVRITLLTSSRVNFKNVLSDAGINQSRHQLMLEIRVDADVLLPWEIRSTSVTEEILVAETVVVGHVPETFVKIGE